MILHEGRRDALVRLLLKQSPVIGISKPCLCTIHLSCSPPGEPIMIIYRPMKTYFRQQPYYRHP